VGDNSGEVHGGRRREQREGHGRVDRGERHLERSATGATVLWVHHSNKAGTGERGSSALRGACDLLLSLLPADDVVTLSCEKARDFAAVRFRCAFASCRGGFLIVEPPIIRRRLRTDDGTGARTRRAGRVLWATGATGAELRAVLPECRAVLLPRAETAR